MSDPERCAGVVQEVDPPLLREHGPLTSTGGHWTSEDGAVTADTVVWALRNETWNCDNAFVAAHNAAIEITACGRSPGYDVAALAAGALERIEALANITA